MGTGGWAWILSDMKSVLETGRSMSRYFRQTLRFGGFEVEITIL